MDDIATIVKGYCGISDFQRKVYLALLDVRKGQIITYKQLADRCGCRSAQAIGQALKRNPFAVGCRIGDRTFTIDYCVPCHRVISSSGNIGGFMGMTQGDKVDLKRELLKQEGYIVSKHILIPG